MRRFHLLILGLTLSLLTQTASANLSCRALFTNRTALEVLAPGLSGMQTLGAKAVLRVSSLGKLLKAYDEIRAGRVLGENFFEKFVNALKVSVEFDAAKLAAIPKSGPLVITSNHPYGGLDGIILMSMILKVRPDVKFLGMEFLSRLPELSANIIPVSFENSSAGRAAREKSLRDATEHVKNGGAIVLFPAGGVSQAPLGNLRKPVDAPWKPGAARMLVDTGAASLSVRFPGANSLAFQLAGKVPGLRPSFLGGEIVNKAGQTIEVRLGDVIQKNWKEDFDNRPAITEFLRANTEAL